MKYYKALLFGSIGSIVETSEIQRKSFNKAFKQYGLDWNWTKREYQNLLSKSGGKDRISRYAKKKKIEVNSVYLRNLKTKFFNNYLKKNHLKLRPGVKNLIFTSSVAIYGLNKSNPDENHSHDPFNHYGKSKWEAELAIKKWYEQDPDKKSVTIIRPTVIFGEKNRGNVYNLLKQIALGKFLMIGKGQNKKSMAYIRNVVAFIKYRMKTDQKGLHVFNYVDKPDLSMSSLLIIINKTLKKNTPLIKLPIWVGFLAGYFFDLLAFLTKKKLPVSSVRVKKFISTTQFDATKVNSSGFKPPFTLEEGLRRTLKYEFIEKRYKNDEVFYSE